MRETPADHAAKEIRADEAAAALRAGDAAVSHIPLLTGPENGAAQPHSQQVCYGT